MSYRASVVSPLPNYGLGTMPGSSRDNITTYSSSYSRHRTPSAGRRTSGSTSTYSPSTSRPVGSSGRPLPTGRGPLDPSGRKLSNNYSLTDTKNYTSSLRSPVRANHTYGSSTSNRDFSTTIGTLPTRKYSPSNSVGRETVSSRHQRSRSVANLDRVDRVTSDISNLKINGYDGVKSSSRIIDPDDDVHSRTSRKDRYNFDQYNDDNMRTGSRVSRVSSNSDNKSIQNDDIFSPRDKENLGRTSSLSRDVITSRRDSSNEIQTTKHLSRQNSSSSITNQTQYGSSGKVGLRNIGNTCFMNSVLQCLSNTRPLLEYCLKEDYIMDKNKTTSKLKGALIIAYANLINSFWKDKSSSYVSPNSFKSQIQKFAPRFSGYQQQDSQEFLRYLLEGLHEDVNKVTEKPKPVSLNDDDYSSDSDKAVEYWNNYLRYDRSKIVEIFVGQLKSELKFKECDHRSVTFDPFWDLSLPVPKLKSECDISDCLEAFMKEEILDGDESPTCAKCKKRRACTKRFSIQKFPPILVLHLKRFSQERYSRKITTLVNFPISRLDLSEFAAEKGQKPVYNLYAVSEHSGTTYGGHYTAKCKHPFTGEWNDFNDTRVSQCGGNQAVSSEAYVLFYELASGSQSRL